MKLVTAVAGYLLIYPYIMDKTVKFFKKSNCKVG